MPNDNMTATEGVEAAAATEEAKATETSTQAATDTPADKGEAPAGDGQKEGGPAPDVRDAYKLDTVVDEPKETPGDAPKEGETQPQDEYKIEWPEGVEADPGFEALTTKAAKAAGLDGKAAGAYTSAVLDALNAEGLEAIAREDAALKQEWGGEYEGNMKVCKAFTAQLMREAGLGAGDLAMLENPKGFRLLYALASRTGEQAAHGTAPQAATQAATQDDGGWAHEVMHNPAHPDYKAFHDVRDARYREVNAKYNRIRFGV